MGKSNRIDDLQSINHSHVNFLLWERTVCRADLAETHRQLSTLYRIEMTERKGIVEEKSGLLNLNIYNTSVCLYAFLLISFLIRL